MPKKICKLQRPCELDDLRRVYDDSVEFISDVASYPKVSAIAYDGRLSKAIRAKIVPMGVKDRVDNLLYRYDKVLKRKWRSHNNSLVEKLASGIGKAEDDRDKKRAAIAAALALLGEDLSTSAYDYYRQAYLIGKERGASISGVDFKRSLNATQRDRLVSMTGRNEEFLKNFMGDLEKKYVDELSKERRTPEEKKSALQRVMESSEARLGLYAFAALSALAMGMTDGIREAQKTRAEEADVPLDEAEIVTGLIWVTNHDDAVCPGCTDNDGKFFTFEEFESEYQTNECLVRCRCAETSVPTAEDPSRFGRSARLGDLQKGGPGSGCHGPNCGRPSEGGGQKNPLHQEALKYKSAKEFVGAQPIVYHGSPVELKQFSNKKGGVFFTSEYADATGFAGTPDNVYEGYLNFKKPLVIDAKGAKWDELNTKYGRSTREVLSNAQKDGYDGIVFENIVDNISDTADYGGQSTVYYAYKPRDAFLNESQLTDIYNQATLRDVEKGGPGSGSWEGPGSPRFPHSGQGKLITDFKPAIRIGDKVFEGKKGQLHSNIMMENPEIEDAVDKDQPWLAGFVDEDGKFYGRSELHGLTAEMVRDQLQEKLYKFYDEVSKRFDKAERWSRGMERPFGFDPNSTANEGRFRLYPLDEIDPDSYFRRESSSDGVSYVMGVPKDGEAAVIQAVRFNRDKFDESGAYEWWKKNGEKFDFYNHEVKKGGAGSGSWEAPGQPRFAHTPTLKPEDLAIKPEALGVITPDTGREPQSEATKPTEQSTESKPNDSARESLKPMAVEVSERAKAEEKKITPIIKDLAQKTGGVARGLEFRTKTESSILRKMVDEYNANPNLSPKEVALKIRDSVRYTLEFKDESYTNNVQDALKTLETDGYKVVKVKNYWGRGDPYQGVNVVMESPNGHTWELQFHTAKSFAVKEKDLHPIYEKFRVSKKPDVKKKLWDRMVYLADRIPAPANVLSIGALSSQVFKTARGLTRYFALIPSMEIESGSVSGVFRMVNDDEGLSFEYIDKNGNWVEDPELAAFLLGSEGAQEISNAKMEEILGGWELKKGGAGSGSWEGPGNPRFAHIGTGEMKMRVKNPGVFKYNPKDPVSTKGYDEKIVEKFSITGGGEFVPSSPAEAHGASLQNAGVPETEYDKAVRVIQDPKRKLVFMRFGGVSSAEMDRARDGDERIWNTVVERQRALAESLYGRHPGTKVILASGGPPDKGGVFRDRSAMIDEGSDIPSKPEQFFDRKYIYTV